MEHVCELCNPNAVEVGEIIPGGWLVLNNGVWAIWAGHGHREDPLLIFPDKPTPDPDPECETDDEAWLDEVIDWSDGVKMRPGDGYFLVNGCKEAGYSKGMYLMWLYDRAGKMIQEHEQRSGVK